jgi:hypothetical protein
MNRIIINEQHKLTAAQVSIFQDRFPEGYEIVPVPSSGWTLGQIKARSDAWLNNSKPGDSFVFVSPIPAMIKLLTKGAEWIMWNHKYTVNVYVFHNDLREKVEKDGRISYLLLEKGWELV